MYCSSCVVEISQGRYERRLRVRGIRESLPQ
jgi:hypothetical protein